MSVMPMLGDRVFGTTSVMENGCFYGAIVEDATPIHRPVNYDIGHTWLVSLDLPIKMVE